MRGERTRDRISVAYSIRARDEIRTTTVKSGCRIRARQHVYNRLVWYNNVPWSDFRVAVIAKNGKPADFREARARAPFADNAIIIISAD